MMTLGSIDDHLKLKEKICPIKIYKSNRKSMCLSVCTKGYCKTDMVLPYSLWYVLWYAFIIMNIFIRIKNAFFIYLSKFECFKFNFNAYQQNISGTFTEISGWALYPPPSSP